MKILWAGPFYSDLALHGKQAVNQAAARWSRGLLHGLEASGCEIRVVSHCAEQRWPRGRIFWQNNHPEWFLDWYPCERVGYCNCAGIKDWWISRAYVRTVRRVCKTWRPDVLLCYNSLHPFHVAAMQEAKRWGVLTVPIILDGDDPLRDQWRGMIRDNRFASGLVFLSYWMHQNYPDKNRPCLHLDGGADEFKGLDPKPRADSIDPQKYLLVHTGALDYWRGLDFMKEVVRKCTRSDVRFVFCGKCDKEKMAANFGFDPRVEIRGFLPDKEVDELCQSADVLLNVREPKIGENLVNYPSKVGQYLAWGKPIVSTWLESFSPDYRKVLSVCDEMTPESFLRKIDEVLAWDFTKRIEAFNQIRSWFELNKTWKNQAARLVAFLEKMIKDIRS